MVNPVPETSLAAAVGAAVDGVQCLGEFEFLGVVSRVVAVPQGWVRCGEVSFAAGRCLVVILTPEFGERRALKGLVGPPFASAMSPSFWDAPSPCL